MGRRIETHTMLGSNQKKLLTNNGEVLNKKFATELISEYFEEFEGFDFQIEEDYVLFGIIPAYQFDKLKIICIHKNKGLSFIKTGQAKDYYGEGVRTTTKYYREYKNKCKFIKFIDRWHEEITDVTSDSLYMV